MANSTYYEVVNRVLQHAGQTPIASTSDFGSNSTLDKPQLQAKLFVDKVNRRLLRKNRPRFTARKATLSLVDGTNSYSLPAAVRIESLIEDSFFITTSGYGYGPLKHLDYKKWKTEFPEGEDTEGEPRRWIDLVPDGTEVDKVAFSPPPGMSLTVEYQYYTDPTALSAHGDIILWPPKFEDIIWDYAQLYLEIVLSEGKAGDLAQLMADLDQEIRQLTMGAIDDPPTMDIGMRFHAGPQRGRRTVR